MSRILTVGAAAALIVMFVACGGRGGNDAKNDDREQEIARLRKQVESLEAELKQAKAAKPVRDAAPPPRQEKAAKPQQQPVAFDPAQTRKLLTRKDRAVTKDDPVYRQLYRASLRTNEIRGNLAHCYFVEPGYPEGDVFIALPENARVGQVWTVDFKLVSYRDSSQNVLLRDAGEWSLDYVATVSIRDATPEERER